MNQEHDWKTVQQIKDGYFRNGRPGALMLASMRQAEFTDREISEHMADMLTFLTCGVIDFLAGYPPAVFIGNVADPGHRFFNIAKAMVNVVTLMQAERNGAAIPTRDIFNRLCDENDGTLAPVDLLWFSAAHALVQKYGLLTQAGEINPGG